MALSDSTASLLFRITADNAQAIENMAALNAAIDKFNADLIAADTRTNAVLATSAKVLADEKIAQSKRANLEAIAAIKETEAAQTAATAEMTAAATGAATGIGIVAVAAAGAGLALFEIAKHASEFGAAIYDAHIKTGLSVESIGALRYAADQANIPFATLQTSIVLFEKVLGNAAEGSKTAAHTLVRLGLDPKTAFESLDGSLQQVFKRINELPVGSIQRTKLETEAFGKSGAALGQIIQETGGDFDKFKQRLKETGVLLSEDDVAAAKEFERGLKALKNEASRAGVEFATGFMPAITTAMKEISGSLVDNESVWRKWGETIGDIILRLTRGVQLLAGVMRDLSQSGAGGISTANTLAALQLNAEGYDSDQRRKAIAAAENSPNRPDFLKQQDKDIGRSVIAAGDNALEDFHKAPKGKKSFGESEAEKFHHKVLELAAAHSFTESSYRRGGKQINAGSLHGSGLADDFSVRGKSVEEIVGLIAGGIKDGFRAIDETVHQPGITSHGKHIHLERGGTKASLFGTAETYGGGEEGAATLAYLRDLDAKRLNKTGGTEGDIEAYTEKRKAEIEKERNDRIQDLKDKIKENQEADKEIADNALEILADEHDQKLKSEVAYAKETGAIKLNALEKQLKDNEELLKNKDVQASPDKKDEITKESASLKRQIAQQTVENYHNERDALEKVNEQLTKEFDTLLKLREENRQGEIDAMDVEKSNEREILVEQTKIGNAKEMLEALKVLRAFDLDEVKRKAAEARLQAQIDKQEADDQAGEITNEQIRGKILDENNKKYQRKLELITQLESKQKSDIGKQQDAPISDAETNASKGIAGQAADILGGLFGHASNTDANGKIKSQADYLKGVYSDIAGSARKATGDMVSGLTDLVTQWITTGKISGTAALQMAAGIATGLAIQSGIKALYEYAEGLAMAANPFTAALAPGHFAAATAYAEVAAAAGVVGVGLGFAARAAGGGSASSAAASATGNGTGTPASTTTVDRNTAIVTSEGRNDGRGDNSGAQTIYLSIPRGMVQQHVMDDFNNNGVIRTKILKLVNG